MSPPTLSLPQRVDTTALVVRWREHGDRAARDELFERFLPLARKLAGRYISPREPLEDLVQVASVGLLSAIDRFDPHRGVRFPAFAIPTILGELKRHFRKAGWSAHVPRGAQEMALRVDRAAREIAAQSGHQPRTEELAVFLEVSSEDARARCKRLRPSLGRRASRQGARTAAGGPRPRA